ncbi:gonadal somatic cell derived factor [Nelusetta ayraudi]|uniref:gonadal somatic cell derived factor n=1 Tax=Nelusetta ayraudi TaxID=303726 RepID=UPI003F6EE794
MSLTLVVMMMLVGSSVVFAFVVQPAREEPAASASSPVLHHRCHGASLESIRRALLRSLNLQAEPQPRATSVHAARKQWRSVYSRMAHIIKDAAVAAQPADGDTGTSMKCCSTAHEILMTDLGWDSWVIHPDSITVVQCARCNPEGNPVQCLTSHTEEHGTESQEPVPCCQPSAGTMLPVIYMDQLDSVVISSVQLPGSCGCAHGGGGQQ